MGYFPSKQGAGYIPSGQTNQVLVDLMPIRPTLAIATDRTGTHSTGDEMHILDLKYRHVELSSIFLS